MTEKSIFWTTSTTGDGANPYTQDEVIAAIEALVSRQTARNGVFPIDNKLEVLGIDHVTTPQLTIDTGRAVVRGFIYRNDALLTKNLVLPVVDTTGWRLVIRATGGTTRTIRIELLQSADGVSDIPAATQNSGFPASGVWEISIAYGTVTTGGDVTVTDHRNFCQFLVTDREGGSATDWDTVGSTDYHLSDVPQVQVGVINLKVLATTDSGAVVGTFPAAFGHHPIVFATVQGASFGGYYLTQIIVDTSSVSESNFGFLALQNAIDPAADHDYSISWLAIGPRV